VFGSLGPQLVHVFARSLSPTYLAFYLSCAALAALFIAVVSFVRLPKKRKPPPLASSAGAAEGALASSAASSAALLQDGGGGGQSEGAAGRAKRGPDDRGGKPSEKPRAWSFNSGRQRHEHPRLDDDDELQSWAGNGGWGGGKGGAGDGDGDGGGGRDGDGSVLRTERLPSGFMDPTYGTHTFRSATGELPPLAPEVEVGRQLSASEPQQPVRRRGAAPASAASRGGRGAKTELHLEGSKTTPLLDRRESLVGSASGDASPRPAPGCMDIFSRPLVAVAVLSGVTATFVMTVVMAATALAMNTIYGFDLLTTTSVIQAHLACMFLPGIFTGDIMSRCGKVWTGTGNGEWGNGGTGVYRQGIQVSLLPPQTHM
jgi:hypothetical protein